MRTISLDSPYENIRMSIEQEISRGLTPAEWQMLLSSFPMENPKVDDSLAKMQRKAGQQDVIAWMKARFECPVLPK